MKVHSFLFPCGIEMGTWSGCIPSLKRVLSLAGAPAASSWFGHLPFFPPTCMHSQTHSWVPNLALSCGTQQSVHLHLQEAKKRAMLLFTVQLCAYYFAPLTYRPSPIPPTLSSLPLSVQKRNKKKKQSDWAESCLIIPCRSLYSLFCQAHVSYSIKQLFSLWRDRDLAWEGLALLHTAFGPLQVLWSPPCFHSSRVLGSASVTDMINMNVAGVYPSVFFVSKNVVPFVNSREKYWTYIEKKKRRAIINYFFGFFCYIYFLVLESSL